ncbi:MAG TPA: hypothetical protein ENK37_09425 [Oceanithermus profundus]|uniref:Uncharacterized protein n=1 Tax=Oceanithermus profundus TaxID=187137 RepID=A0A7C4V7U3_9DEIN|nr:hypothetical protein [Oceanithermus profundus]
MRERKLLHTSEEAKILGTGVANRKVSVLEFVVPEGATYLLRNAAQLVMKLFDAGGSELPPSSFVYLYKRRKGEDGEVFLTKQSYAPFFDLSAGEQRNDKFAKGTRVDLGVAPGARFTEGDAIQVWVESPAVVDLTHANTRFELTVGLE